MAKRLEHAKAIWNRPTISIQASGRDDGRIDKPNTRQHQNLRAPISRTIHFIQLLHRRAYVANRNHNQRALCDQSRRASGVDSHP